MLVGQRRARESKTNLCVRLKLPDEDFEVTAVVGLRRRGRECVLRLENWIQAVRLAVHLQDLNHLPRAPRGGSGRPPRKTRSKGVLEVCWSRNTRHRCSILSLPLEHFVEHTGHQGSQAAKVAENVRDDRHIGRPDDAAGLVDQGRGGTVQGLEKLLRRDEGTLDRPMRLGGRTSGPML